ncbi:2001_t:CDS:1, partial [Paraglomus brasilianum]
VSDETSISEISAKPHMSSLIESNSQMGPSLEALPLPAVASTLMSPLSAYIFLALLIIAVIVILRREWGFERKKSDRLRDTWIG